MPEPQPARISLRPAAQDDCQRLWDWRNEADTREASLNTQVIPYEDHEKWFSRKLRAQDTQIFILVDADGHGVGYVRFNIEGDEAEISVSVDKGERGKGYGAEAIRLGSEQLLIPGSVNRVIAYIKENNPASIAAFQRAGYDPMGLKEIAGTTARVMTYRRCP